MLKIDIVIIIIIIEVMRKEKKVFSFLEAPGSWSRLLWQPGDATLLGGT